MDLSTQNHPELPLGGTDKQDSSAQLAYVLSLSHLTAKLQTKGGNVYMYNLIQSSFLD